MDEREQKKYWMIFNIKSSLKKTSWQNRKRREIPSSDKGCIKIMLNGETFEALSL